MRYLLYLTKDDLGEEIQYLIDRKNDYWFIPKGGLHFPVPRDIEAFHTNTLIDGELVIDKFPDGRTQPKYLVFDCMVLDGNSLMNRSLVKQMQFSYAIEMMFRKILPELPHGNDGLIFTCRSSEYKHGTDPHILKWKPESENSIDFRLSLQFPSVQPDETDIAEGITEPYLDYDAIPICNLLVYAGDGREDPWYSTMYIEPEEWESLKSLQQPLDDRIVECYMDARKQWRYMRFRDDKTTANHISTVESVIESITDRVTEKDLIAAAKGIRDEWKKRAAEEQARDRKEMERKRAAATAAPPNNNAKRKADEQGDRRPSPAPPGKRD
jgi:mRNA guanylyltransferase